MAAKRDYYEVLGVEKTATADELKSAFRRRAKECHPDLHPDDKEAEARFKELNEAYEVLSDPDKRAHYDQFGFNDPMQGMGGGSYGGNPFGAGGFGDLGDILNAFGFGGMGGMGQTVRNAPRRGSDVAYQLTLTFEEAADGCEQKFPYYREEQCEKCGGTGAKPGTQASTCPTCRGAGQVRTSAGYFTSVRTCPTCGGAGKVITDKCPNCGGGGYLRRNRTATIRVPAGVDNGDMKRMSGAGNAGRNGGPNGDLLIQFRVKPHKLFKRDGYDLLLDFPISFTQAALGAEVDVPALHETVKLKIPEGTQSDTDFRIKGKGIQRLNSPLKGDLIVHVRVEIPRRLSERQRELLRQFDGTVTGKEYEGRKSFLDKLKDVFQ